MTVASARRERRQFELERDFVRKPVALPAPKRKRSSIELPAFHGVSFRIVTAKNGRPQRRSGYHQLDGSWELADICTCRTDWQPDFQVEPDPHCPIDEHKIRAQRAFT